jgi:hypothetical protein
VWSDRAAAEAVARPGRVPLANMAPYLIRKEFCIGARHLSRQLLTT